MVCVSAQCYLQKRHIESGKLTAQTKPTDCMQTPYPSAPAHPARNRALHWILGLPFDAISLAEAVQTVRNAARQRTPLFISTPNLNFLIASQKDPAFRNSVIHSDLSLADGMPILWLAKLLKVPIRERVAGSTLFEQLRYSPLEPEDRPLRVYFFGGPDGVAEKAANTINQDSTSMQCVGYCSPGFGSLDDISTPDLLARINASEADFVVVSLGAKKGQAWIERNRTHLHAPIISHLGAVVNFVAGNVQRAPVWMQRVGLEWVWRIKEEPNLYKRYISDGISFLSIVGNIAIRKALHPSQTKAEK